MKFPGFQTANFIFNPIIEPSSKDFVKQASDYAKEMVERKYTIDVVAKNIEKVLKEA